MGREESKARGSPFSGASISVEKGAKEVLGGPTLSLGPMISQVKLEGLPHFNRQKPHICE